MKLSRIMRFGLTIGRIIGPEISEKRRAGCTPIDACRNLVLLLFLISIPGGTHQPSQQVSLLERVKRSGELRVATRYGPSTYSEGINGLGGLEHDLALLFAERVGVKPKFLVRRSMTKVLRQVAEGDADIAAAGLTVHEEWKTRVHFAAPYRRIREQVLYGRDRGRPQGLVDLTRGVLEVPAGSAHLTTLKQMRRRVRNLHWRVDFDHNAADLFYLTSAGAVDFTVADSDQALLLRRYYPALQVAFDIGKPRELAWALPTSEDHSLYNEVVRFFRDIQRNKTLAQLIDRYYGHAEAFDAALDQALRRDFRTRLPRYRHFFLQAGKHYNLDWRLLAAIAYQESKWKSTAVSAEGVRGMMMLTGVTARELRVRDRFNPAESIRGGADYLQQTLANMPQGIREPDRTWYALAAYNLGPGHIEDARNLVRSKGGDPDKWIEIKKVLPLLGKRAWYRNTKYGRARGSVAVHYVNSIRRYYDLLVWLTEEEANGRVAMGLSDGKADGV